tara:strand:- start:1664 stop:1933 length:270 start_codon:yes stop_codon:yes gene_type:complete
MAKKRRKLNKEMESEISAAQKRVELIVAIINDISEEDIQSDYRTSFEPIITTLGELISLYDIEGYNESTIDLISTYNRLITSFENEYEL